jgi:RNA-directed DNA polymerase
VARGRDPRLCGYGEATVGVGGAHSTGRTRRTTQPVRREGALVRGVSRRAKGREIGVSLATPPKLRRLQEAPYTKAKQEPAYRFCLLYDKVYRADILAHAYAHAKQNGGAPGEDGVTFEDIGAAGVEPWLAAVGEALRTKTYRPHPVRRVLIPKPGGTGERPLGIPRILDRVVQTAVLLILQPIFEADLEPTAYGYRPGRTGLETVQEVHRALCAGQTEVVEADVSNYFDTVPHCDLMKSLARRISDRKMLRLLKMWLKAPVAERIEGGGWRMSGGKRATRGTPQGGVISPLLALIYMNRYLKVFRLRGLDRRYGARLVNYADDFVVLCRTGAAEVLAQSRRWFTQMGLTLNEQKTRVCDGRRESFDFLGYTFGPMRYRKDGHWYLGAAPAQKAVKRVKGRIRQILRPGNQAAWDEVKEELNRVLRGWAHYFAYGTRLMAHRAVDHCVYEHVRQFLRRRHKVPRARGEEAFSRGAGLRGVGGVPAAALPSRVACACQGVKPVREPDVRKGQVRFDEKGQETE